MSTLFPGGMAVSQGVSGATAEIGGRLANTAPGTAVTNTVTETASVTYTIPANLLTAGRAIEVAYCGRATATNSTDTLTVKAKVGSQAIITTSAVDVANGDKFKGHFILAALEAPSDDSACVAYGSYTDPAGTTEKPVQLAPTDLDTNSTLAITVTLTWSVANAGNSARVDHFHVRLV